MSTSALGTPCWYELATSDLDGAARFYGTVLGWTVVDSGMEGFTYHLASTAEGHGVAGMMSNEHMAGAPPFWLVYFAVDGADQAAADVRARGGSVIVEPTDIPGTGRFAVVADPQGAGFGLLQPQPMDGPPEVAAFDQARAGHGNWLELASSDPQAGFDFYQGLFGWTASDAMDMGDMGTYQLFAHQGADIGGMMGLGESPVSAWLPYFGTGDIDRTVADIQSAGGTVVHGPGQVPGGAWIVVATDPQGAPVAFVGSRAG